MELRAAIASRRSVRRFREAEVTEEQLRTLLEAADASPSAGNLQGYRIVVVRSRERKAQAAEAAFGQTFITGASVLLGFVADFPTSGARYGDRSALYAIQDATIAAAYVTLAATDLELGTCWIGAFDDDKMADVLGVPEGCRPVAVLAIGHPDEEPAARPRKRLAELVREERCDGRPYADP